MNKSVLVLAMILAVGFTAEFCWKHNYGRGIGTPVHTCKGNQERNGALCYDRCGEGFYGNGPVCWAHCNAGYHDDGAFCRRDAQIYGRGCCCNYHTGECCTCPDNFHADPCTCRKDLHIYAKASYGRGAGYFMSCNDDQDYDAGLCYNKCGAGYTGVGPYCWANCPNGWSNCGLACAMDNNKCGEVIINMVAETGGAVASTIALMFGGPGASKAVQQAAKVVKIVGKAVKYSSKIAHFANNFFNKAQEMGKPMSHEESFELANSKLGELMGDASDEVALEAAMQAMELLDPTGIVAAVHSYVHPQCNMLH